MRAAADFMSPDSQNATPWMGRVVTTVFWVVCAGYLAANAIAVITQPYNVNSLLGAPDEPLHRDLVEFLANHGHWPDFDDPSLRRTLNGLSYGTGSSFGYWLHAMGAKLLGLHRLGGCLLFSALLVAAVQLFKRNALAGVAALAMVTPQVLFIFSYENSDAWVTFVGLAFGAACAMLQHNPAREHFWWAFALTAALVPSARFHLWLPCFMLFCLTLVVVRSSVPKLSPARWTALAAVTLLIAAWWPVTSYLHNGHDPAGLWATAQAQIRFGSPMHNGIALSQFPWKQFLGTTLKSAYGTYGSMAVYPTGWAYESAACLAFLAAALSLRFASWQSVILGGALVSCAVLLLILYSTTYDYQPQGRYLFCGLAPWAGVVLSNLALSPPVLRPQLATALIGVFCALALTNLRTTAELMHLSGMLANNQHLFLGRTESPKSSDGDIHFCVDGFFASPASTPTGSSGRGQDLRIVGWAFPLNSTTGTVTTTVTLTNGDGAYLLRTHATLREDIPRAFPELHPPKEAGFVTVSSHVERVPPGTYRIWLNVHSGGQTQIKDTGHDVVIEG